MLRSSVAAVKWVARSHRLERDRSAATIQGFKAPDHGAGGRFELLTCALRDRSTASLFVPLGLPLSLSLLSWSCDSGVRDFPEPTGMGWEPSCWDSAGTDQSVLMYRRNAPPTTSEEIVPRRGTLVDDQPQFGNESYRQGIRWPSRRPTPAPTASRLEGAGIEARAAHPSAKGLPTVLQRVSFSSRQQLGRTRAAD